VGIAGNGKYGDENNCWKADDSVTSFLFTLKNPHNIPARRFALKFKKKRAAIYCSSTRGPCFGDGWGCDIAVRENCNSNTNSNTWLGTVYTNDTGLRDTVVLTGSENFRVKEIEVFEITE
jgi:hypothetical protein